MMTVMSIGLISCNESDDYTPAIAIQSVSIVPYENTVSYLCTGNYNSNILDNKQDPVAFDVAKENLQKATLTATTTLGVGVQAYYNGELLTAEGVTVDATKPIQLEVRGYNISRTYTVQVEQATSMPENEHLVIKSTDMRMMGVDKNTYSYNTAGFNGKIYCFSSGLNGSTAEYKIFSSDNGVKWEEVKYGPDDLQAIGGNGVALITYHDRLFALGGSRTKGTDQWGNAPELNWGMPSINYWRSVSTADGQTFRCDTIGTKGEWSTNYNGKPVWKNYSPTPTTNLSTVVFNDKMYIKGGSYYGFGMLQGLRAYMVCEDGTNWKNIDIKGETVNNHNQDAFFTFKGKMWSIGGFKSYINQKNIVTGIYSSANGVDWTQEAENGPFGAMWGMTAAVGEDAVYLIGGESLSNDGSKRILSDKIYRSTDAIHWEEVTSSSKYTARRNARVAILGDYAYIFGGYNTPSDTYGNSKDTDTPMFDTFILELK